MSITRLPEDIQIDIFVRLPVKSIQRCRRVCKPLCKLLSNLDFIKHHLNHNSSKKNPKLLLISSVQKRFSSMCRSIDYASIPSAGSATCDGAIPMDSFQNEWSSSYNKTHVVGSCNGLVCIWIADIRFCIWNPSTGEHKEILCYTKIGSYVGDEVRYGFGYDSHSDQYKLVKIVTDKINKTGLFYSQIEVCTLGGSNTSWETYNFSWKTIQTMKQYLFSFFLPINDSCLCLFNGALHWPAYIQATSSRVIVSFDISSETFVELLYPEEVEQRRNKYQHVGLLEDRLSMIVCDNTNYSGLPIDVWLMQDYGVRESWTKQFSFTPPCSVQKYALKLVWSFPNGEVLIDTGYEKLLYDPKIGSTRFLRITGFETELSRPVIYMESLISFNSATLAEERKASQVRKKQKT